MITTTDLRAMINKAELNYAAALRIIDEPTNRYRRNGKATVLVGCAGGRRRYAWLTASADRIIVTLHGNTVAWLTPTCTVLFPFGWEPTWCTQTTRQLLELLTGGEVSVVGSTRQPNPYASWEYRRQANHGTGFTLNGARLKPATFLNVTGDIEALEVEVAYAGLERIATVG